MAPKKIFWRLIMNRVLKNLSSVVVLIILPSAASVLRAHPAADAPPKVIVIFADVPGYGDLGCFGHPTIRTPNLARIAAEGIKLTEFYAAASVCTPSRAALVTGRRPIRNGMCSDVRRVLFPNSGDGIPASEITIAEALREQGYATACIGKWHLGHLPQFLPTRNGFDRYFGIPYSNDVDRANGVPAGLAAFWQPESRYFNVPLMQDEQRVRSVECAWRPVKLLCFLRD